MFFSNASNHQASQMVIFKLSTVSEVKRLLCKRVGHPRLFCVASLNILSRVVIEKRLNICQALELASICVQTCLDMSNTSKLAAECAVGKSMITQYIFSRVLPSSLAHLRKIACIETDVRGPTILKELQRCKKSFSFHANHLAIVKISSADAMKTIILKRLQNIALIDSEALDALVKNVIDTEKNVSQACELVRTCIQIRIQTMDAGVLEKQLKNSPYCWHCILNEVFVASVIKDTPSRRKAIQSLPQAAQVVLCVATILCEFKTAARHITEGDLLLFCREAAIHGKLCDITVPYFIDILNTMADAMLVIISDDCGWGEAPIFDKDTPLVFDKDMPLKFCVTMSEVEIALDTNLSKQPYYAKLAELAK
jgi:hypothetical protein